MKACHRASGIGDAGLQKGAMWNARWKRGHGEFSVFGAVVMVVVGGGGEVEPLGVVFDDVLS